MLFVELDSEVNAREQEERIGLTDFFDPDAQEGVGH